MEKAVKCTQNVLPDFVQVPQILKRFLLPVYGTVQVSQNKTTTSNFSY